MSEAADRVFVFFNNCNRAQAVRNATEMMALLQQAGLDVVAPQPADATSPPQ